MTANPQTLTSPPAPPPTVTAALWMIGLSTGLGVLVTLLRTPNTLTAVVLVLLVGACLNAMRHRRRWGRFVYTAVWLVGLPFTVYVLPRTFDADPLVAWASLLQTLVQLAALMLLYRSDASSWFAARAAAT